MRPGGGAGTTGQRDDSPSFASSAGWSENGPDEPRPVAARPGAKTRSRRGAGARDEDRVREPLEAPGVMAIATNMDGARGQARAPVAETRAADRPRCRRASRSRGSRTRSRAAAATRRESQSKCGASGGHRRQRPLRRRRRGDRGTARLGSAGPGGSAAGTAGPAAQRARPARLLEVALEQALARWARQPSSRGARAPPQDRHRDLRASIGATAENQRGRGGASGSPLRHAERALEEDTWEVPVFPPTRTARHPRATPGTAGLRHPPPEAPEHGVHVLRRDRELARTSGRKRLELEPARVLDAQREPRAQDLAAVRERGVADRHWSGVTRSYPDRSRRTTVSPGYQRSPKRFFFHSGLGINARGLVGEADARPCVPRPRDEMTECSRRSELHARL